MEPAFRAGDLIRLRPGEKWWFTRDKSSNGDYLRDGDLMLLLSDAVETEDHGKNIMHNCLINGRSAWTYGEREWWRKCWELVQQLGDSTLEKRNERREA